MNTVSETTTTKNKSLLDIKASNQSDSNNLLGVALQSLYEKLQKKNIVGEVSVLEDADPMKTISQENKLLLEKVISITNQI